MPYVRETKGLASPMTITGGDDMKLLRLIGAFALAVFVLGGGIVFLLGGTHQPASATKQVVPTASFTAKSVGDREIKFDGSASTASSKDHVIQEYEWDFGDGVKGTGKTTTHTYAVAYSVKLKVTESSTFAHDDSESTVTVTQATSSPSTTPTSTSASATPLEARFYAERDGQHVVFHGLNSSATDGHFIVKYSWNFGDGSSPVEGSSPDGPHDYATPGDYDVTLTVTESDTGVTAWVTAKIKVDPTVVLNTEPVMVGLEDPGLGSCAPAKEFLDNLRAAKPNGEDFQPQYSASEIEALTKAEIDWIRSNEEKPCVRALANSFGVTAADLPSYYETKLHLIEVGAGGLTIQNSYFDHTDGNVVWWNVQHFPAGELVWIDADGYAVDKYACLNRLRPPPPPPARTVTPASPALPKPSRWR